MTLANIPHIDSAVFKPYLAQAGSLYEAFRKAKDGSDDGRPHFNRKLSKGDQVTTETSYHGMQKRHSGTPSLSRIDSSFLGLTSPLEAPQPRRRTSGGVSRRAGLTVAPLSTIPQVYFEPEFHLENPRTFDIVSERSEIAQAPSAANGSAIVPSSTGKKALASNAILQEKLSWYMDTVEIHLISSISTASTSFFAALGSLRELHAEAAQSVTNIKTLRSDLAKLDQDMAIGGLKIVEMRRRRENMRKLGDAVEQLREIVDSVTRCQEQVNNGEIEVALKGLSNAENLMAGDSIDFSISNPIQRALSQDGNLVDLRGIKALEGADSDIAVLRNRIGKTFEFRFLETLLGDIRRHVDSVPSSKTFQRWDQASNRFRAGYIRTPTEFPTYLQIEGSLRSALLAQLKGLARSDSVMPAAIAYREAILHEFKNLIRKHLPSTNDDDAESMTSIATQESRHLSRQEQSSILARNLRALDAEDAEDMFRKIYSNTGEALRRLGTQVKMLLDITSSLGNPHPNMSMRSPPRSPQLPSIDHFLNAEPSPLPPASSIKQEEIQQTLDLSSLLGQAVDIAQVQITKLLKVRTEQTTNLELLNFLRYFTLNRLFADECEAVSGRAGIDLKTMVNTHIKAFVSHIADVERERLVQTMDSDPWDAKDFTEDAAARLSLIIASSTKDVEAWCKSSLLWETKTRTNGQSHTKSQSNGASLHSSPQATQVKDVQIDSTHNALIAQEEQVTTNGQSQTKSQSNGTPLYASLQAAHINDLQKDKTYSAVTAPVNGASKDKVRSAIIDEQKFILPKSAIALSRGIATFEHLLTAIPSMTSEIAASLLDYLKVFNSRSSQLILGAGATRSSAALRNITTKHLALSSQGLSFAIALIPHIRECVRRHAQSSSSTLVPEFDKVKRLFQEHQAGIHDKLVEIMSGRAAAHVSAMKRIEWDLPAQKEAVSGYMETLVKETATLHKVLSRHLPEGTVLLIMRPVVESYRELWGRAYRGVEVRTPAGKERYVCPVKEEVRLVLTGVDYSATSSSLKLASASWMALAISAITCSILSMKSLRRRSLARELGRRTHRGGRRARGRMVAQKRRDVPLLFSYVLEYFCIPRCPAYRRALAWCLGSQWVVVVGKALAWSGEIGLGVCIAYIPRRIIFTFSGGLSSTIHRAIGLSITARKSHATPPILAPARAIHKIHSLHSPSVPLHIPPPSPNPQPHNPDPITQSYTYSAFTDA